MSGKLGMRHAPKPYMQLPWRLACGHTVLFSVYPRLGDVVWCVRCEGVSVVEGAGK